MENCIADMEVDIQAGEIRGPAGIVRIDPQPMAVLACLLKHRGEFCSRASLFEVAWSDRVVSDGTLTATISGLRQQLRRAGVEDVKIETRSKRGYRLSSVSPTPSSVGNRAPSGRRLPYQRAGLILILFFVLGVGFMFGVPGSAPPTAVRLNYEIKEPDGTLYKPTLIVRAGASGQMTIANPASSGIVALRVRILEIRSDRVRLNTQLLGSTSHVGLVHSLPFESMSRITIPGPAAEESIEVVLHATPAGGDI